MSDKLSTEQYNVLFHCQLIKKMRNKHAVGVFIYTQYTRSLMQHNSESF